MLEIVVPEIELYNEEKNEFVTIPETKLQLEHSLISIQKWESRWHKPFLGSDDKTYEELRDYIYCMTINSKGVNQAVYAFIPNDLMTRVVNYIKDPMTATWFREDTGLIGATKNRSQVITAEVIYYWMISFNIPSEYRMWHLSQLLTLIKVLNEENKPKKKRNAREVAQEWDAINKKRREAFKSKG